MTLQFTAELSYNTPLTFEEKKVTKDIIDKIQRAMAIKKISGLYFLEDVVDRRELQNEFLLNQSKLKGDGNVGDITSTILFPIDPSAFFLDSGGEILSLDLRKIKVKKHSCIFLEFSPEILYSEIIRSIHDNNQETPHKLSNIFWDVWSTLTQK